MKIEMCHNCHEVIGLMEQAYVHGESVVCEKCHQKLNSCHSSPPVQDRPAGGCPLCGGRMIKKTKSEGNAMGIAIALIVLAIGISLTITIVGAIIGVPLILCSLGIGGKRKKLLVCVNCKHAITRA